MRFATFAITLILAVTASPAEAAIKGSWANPSKSVVIMIAPCGETLCGTVSWASEKAKKDSEKGTKHLVGSHLLTHLKKSHDAWHGKLFVPDQNMRVSAKLRLVNNNELKVSGCALMICKSQLWTRTHHHAQT
jgi:uncharacterized protein (DUF2147 family)